MDERSVEVGSTDGVTVVAHHLGGTGEAMVICHATGFHGRAYAPFAVGLVERFAVWAVDFRGHGAATRPSTGSYAWTGMRDDLLAVIDALDLGRPYAVGHSMGGCAVLMAELARPGLIAAAYLYEPIVMPVGHAIPATNEMSVAAARRRDDFTSREEALMRYATRPGLRGLRADALAAYVQHGFVDRPDGGVRLACPSHVEALTFAADTALSVSQIESVTMPTVVGVGTTDLPPSPASYAPHIAAALSKAVVVEYEHLGHFGPLQDPDRIAGEVLTRL